VGLYRRGDQVGPGNQIDAKTRAYARPPAR
jgi:hypothetical protein